MPTMTFCQSKLEVVKAKNIVQLYPVIAINNFRLKVPFRGMFRLRLRLRST